MSNYKLKINGNDYNVNIDEIVNNIAKIDVNGKKYEVEIQQKAGAKTQQVFIPKQQEIAAPTVKKEVEMPQEVVNEPEDNTQQFEDAKPLLSPLPGVILDIKVEIGDKVNIGETVLVMEAMKMENNIAADCAGTVCNICVAKGDTVMQNDILIEVN